MFFVPNTWRGQFLPPSKNLKILSPRNPYMYHTRTYICRYATLRYGTLRYATVRYGTVLDQ